MDLAQLIAKHSQWCQYALGMLEDVLIADNYFYTQAQRNGIFSSDGLFKELQIINNTIVTKGQHAISVGGVISGVAMGNNVPVVLMPARAGGRPEGMNNVWINSFLREDYGHVVAGSDQVLVDRRRDIINPDDIHIENFDLEGFYEDVNRLNLTKHKTASEYGQSVQLIAIGNGELR